MAFVIDKQEVHSGLVIFRRSDVQHRKWYCRVKLPKEDRYKIFSLRTESIEAARDKAMEHYSEVRFSLKHGVPVFNRPFSAVAKEFLAEQEVKALRGEISKDRPRKLRTVIDRPLQAYVGSTQIHLIGQETWENYPGWRRENGVGRLRDKRISDSTIRFEMSVFLGVMTFAIKKRYVPANLSFEKKPKLKTMRRDEFTLEEYRKLHTVGRAWVAKASKPSSTWYRTVAYNFILIMCNTGMRPSEAKNLRWRDVKPAKDREGREIVVLFVQGKGKSRNLVAPKSVLDYLERIRALSKAAEPDNRVFTTITGKPATTIYKNMIESVLVEAGLRDGTNGVPRSTYCFRHTYATFRLSEGVDVYFLAEQMGTSVKMIEDHYGHVNTVKHADRVLMGMGGWEPVERTDADKEGDAKAAGAAGARQRTATRSKTKH
ncbi:tyrosine-type recombinase/integrase [Tahibacter soli]|uniref:Site-specific integrase n=1 Tax=Tahibacter soli TaxID=2983605 RepID=A0A9X4BJ15_9GAMM|nr:site-specific integrase [Tahibacter soli]MDC8015855.1 site-specific integrase [Tahibacter soli]